MPHACSVLQVSSELVKGRTIGFPGNRKIENVTVSGYGFAGKFPAEQLLGYQLIESRKSPVVVIKVLDFNCRNRLQVLKRRSFISSMQCRSVARHGGDHHKSD